MAYVATASPSADLRIGWVRLRMGWAMSTDPAHQPLLHVYISTLTHG
jgi:hypothetical protein